MANEIVFTDRYQAMGIPYPDPATMCDGECEGTGFVPHQDNPEEGGIFQGLWEQEHARAHTLRGRLHAMRVCNFLPLHRRLAILWERCDGWHFVRCPDCNGTGKRSAGRARSEETDRNDS